MFFDKLGPERRERIELVSWDGATFIARSVAEWCPDAELCADPSPCGGLVDDALDEVREGVWRRAEAQARADKKKADKLAEEAAAERRGRPPKPVPTAAQRAATYRSARWPLPRNPENLTDKQQAKLGHLRSTDPVPRRAHKLNQALRYVFHAPTLEEAVHALDRWTGWATRCRITEFTELAKTIRRHHEAIVRSLKNRVSNGRVESVNAKLRVITRTAFGFHDVNALIGLAMLSLGGHPPTIPGRK